jgi:hypothetical protein
MLTKPSSNTTRRNTLDSAKSARSNAYKAREMDETKVSIHSEENLSINNTEDRLDTKVQETMH